jgi:hypothetical protein
MSIAVGCDPILTNGLFWEGHVNRSDLMEKFGLSVNQASTDLNRYSGFAPENMVYDKSAPAWRCCITHA